MLGLKDLIEQAQGVQVKIREVQEQLAERSITGSAGGDMVKVEANGIQEILSVSIENEILAADDKEVLEDLIVAAVNDALQKSRQMAADEIAKISGGLRIPGLT
ncbi:MAG: YbaB/EbfC family nucleoid-associated protein [Deltaproteobacteria bacterium]|nr:YbaB/EbfC family nucleoid-associated protein [Deltaproteobacteria bacterium]